MISLSGKASYHKKDGVYLMISEKLSPQFQEATGISQPEWYSKSAEASISRNSDFIFLLSQEVSLILFNKD